MPRIFLTKKHIIVIWLDEPGTCDGMYLGESGADSDPIETTIFAIPYRTALITDPHPIGVVGGGVDDAGGDGGFTDVPCGVVAIQMIVDDPED